MKELQISSSLKEGWLFDTKLTDFFFFSFFFMLFVVCPKDLKQQQESRALLAMKTRQVFRNEAMVLSF